MLLTLKSHSNHHNSLNHTSNMQKHKNQSCSKNKRMLCLNLVGRKISITLTCIIFTKYKSLLYPCTVLTYLLNEILNKRDIEDP
jgi:hypothetical protein